MICILLVVGYVFTVRTIHRQPVTLLDTLDTHNGADRV